MSTVAELLRWAVAQLADSPEPDTDAQALLAHLLERDRGWLFAWGDKTLDDATAERYRELVAQRAAGTPVAYLTGSRGFWSLDLAVDEHTLIPRPETEHLVEKVLQLGAANQALRVLDMGTGSGAIALAIASERPHWQVTASDTSAGALAMAQRNAQSHAIRNVRFVHSDWFEHIHGRFDLIASNPPYIADGDPHLAKGDLRFEPRSALAAGSDGLDDIRRIVAQAAQHLYPGGWLLLEHGWQQGAECRELLIAQGFTRVASERDLAGHERLSYGKIPT